MRRCLSAFDVFFSHKQDVSLTAPNNSLKNHRHSGLKLRLSATTSTTTLPKVCWPLLHMVRSPSLHPCTEVGSRTKRCCWRVCCTKRVNLTTTTKPHKSYIRSDRSHRWLNTCGSQTKVKLILKVKCESQVAHMLIHPQSHARIHRTLCANRRQI